MGYYVTGKGQVTIPTNKREAALEALKALNNRNDLKHGGSYSPGQESVDTPGPREDRWFSWLPWDYDQNVESIVDVLELLGFEVLTKRDVATGFVTYELYYDNKTGQEDLFLEVLGRFVTEGWLEWVGEDHAMWRQDFSNGRVTNKVLVGYVWG